MDIQEEKILEYVYSFETPADLDFFTEKENAKLEKENRKYTKTQDYLAAVADNPALGKKLEQDTAIGTIYSQGELNKIESRNHAIERMGERMFPNISAVTPSGQRVIMSEYCSNKLGFLTDGYIKQDELEDLVDILHAERISENQISKVREAMGKYFAIILQRGAYEALFDLLDEATSSVLSNSKPQLASTPAVLEDNLAADNKELAIMPEPLSAAPIERAAIPVPTAPILPKIFVPTPPKIQPIVIPKLNPILPPATSLPKPYPAPKAPAAKNFAGPMEGLATLDNIKTVDDLKKIQVGHLRQNNIETQLVLIRSKIISLATANRLLPFYAISAFEDSPLYKVYLAMGSHMIADQNQDRKMAFDQSQGSNHPSEALSRQEFEAMADLRKQLEQL